MAIDFDIRDQAYQFFIQEAPELLQVIETELLTLRQERSTAKIHSMMRAAHSIKGGAASVGLEPIKLLAHRLEDIFRALHHEDLDIDAALENGLLQSYDCLRLPLMEEITIGCFDPDQALAAAESVFAKVEIQLDRFLGANANLPSSIELGVDITASIFEVDVAEGLAQITAVLNGQQNDEIKAELRAQTIVFSNLAELFNLPGFEAITQAILTALDVHPEQAFEIAQIALINLQSAREAVLAGDRVQGGTPSQALLDLASPPQIAASVTLQTELEIEEITLSPTLDDFWETIEHPSDSIDSFNIDEWEMVDEPLVSIGLDTDEIFIQTITTSLPDDIDLYDSVDEEVYQENTDISQVSNDLLKDLTNKFAVLEKQFFNEDSSIAPLTFNLDQNPDQNLDQFIEPQIELIEAVNNQGNRLQEMIVSIEQVFDDLPTVEAVPIVAQPTPLKTSEPAVSTRSIPENYRKYAKPSSATSNPSETASQLSVRVNLDRLERMNNLVGELAINRSSLSLQNEQLQTTVQELLRRFAKFQMMGSHLRDFSDQLSIARDHHSFLPYSPLKEQPLAQFAAKPRTEPSLYLADFDSLEMDSYSDLHLSLQSMLEEIAQIEETVGDVVLLSGQSNQSLEGQRQMLNHLRDDLMWARMLPLSEVLNRFPRILRDLSNAYHKSVNLKLSGTGVLVDKAVLEKLYDPLLHLLRNAFDHGIESSEMRYQQDKTEQGLIEIRAYHQGSQTVIEVQDNGRGIDLEQIRKRSVELNLLSAEQAATVSTSRLLNLLFEPGFSTASQVSELSGRGVGLDIVRAQLQALKGTASVASILGQGTTFTLKIPLTLTIAKLLVCWVNSAALALPSDSIEEILVPRLGQIKQSNGQRFLHWRDSLIPVHPLSSLLAYACPLPESLPNQALVAVPSPADWANPLLLLREDNQFVALEIDRIVTEQELVIKPFGLAIAPPEYIYGCTILGDGNLIPVIDGTALFKKINDLPQISHSAAATADSSNNTINQSGLENRSIETISSAKSATLLIIDDSIAHRQTLALTLQKAGYRVLQARDGREAIEQLQQNSAIQLIICDVEMPNMNGFEFLSYRRQDPVLSKIPITMLTSRGSEKHRRVATHLGANAYITKPYIERELFALLLNLLQPDSESKNTFVLTSPK